MPGPAADRLERERLFHDDRFADHERAADRFYNDSTDRALEAYLARLSARPAPADVLDFGCGAEAHTAIHAAGLGHRTVAVDLSPVAIEQARRRAEEAGVADAIRFEVGNCEALPFPDRAFDVVAGTGVLHHLDLPTAYPEIHRLLRPGGEALFIEPLGHNPVVNLYRTRTPDERTPDEHPLVMGDIEMARRWFDDVDLEYFTLTSLATLPLKALRRRQALVDRLDAVDRALFARVPPVRRFAWRVLMRLGSPRPA